MPRYCKVLPFYLSIHDLRFNHNSCGKAMEQWQFQMRCNNLQRLKIFIQSMLISRKVLFCFSILYFGVVHTVTVTVQIPQYRLPTCTATKKKVLSFRHHQILVKLLFIKSKNEQMQIAFIWVRLKYCCFYKRMSLMEKVI